MCQACFCAFEEHFFVKYSELIHTHCSWAFHMCKCSLDLRLFNDTEPTTPVMYQLRHWIIILYELGGQAIALYSKSYNCE
jgi:hypothetical protein